LPWQTCPTGQGTVVLMQVPVPLQSLVARVDDEQVVPQSVPAARGWQPEPSDRQAPVWQAPPQLSAEQQIPLRHLRPVRHSLLAAQL
jgi:hypothetical protein